MSDRVMIISSDCHINFPAEGGKEYVESKYHDDYDRWVSAMSQMFAGMRTTMMSGEETKVVETSEAIEEELRLRNEFESAPDLELRLKTLEANGVAAEIIIPNPPNVPFEDIPGGRRESPWDRQLHPVGRGMYNRWLAEYVDKDRQGGLLLTSYDDIEWSVDQVRRGAETGMRGVFLEGQMSGVPPLWDDYYEPLWNAMEETGLTGIFHGGAGYEPESMALTNARTAQLMFAEVLWFGHRPLWILAFGGVFDRHPGLKVAFTETHQDWIPGTLKAMDYDMAETAGGIRRQNTGTLGKELMSTYWKRNCFVGASLLSRCEMEMRYDIGVDKLMYGTDFAHREGTFNRTLQYLQALFGYMNISEEETRMILGENAAKVFGFDPKVLAPVVERCGFTIEEVLTPPAGPLDREVEVTMNRPAKGW